jgi:peptidoglycan hydrolase-like protein with peptidoglycan-binding domain
MNSFLGRSLLAGAVVLTLAFPGWAAEEAKTAQVKEEKMEKKAVTPGSDEVKKVQEALKAKGEDPGTIDGIMGKKTHAAIRAFQKANALKVTGSLDQETSGKLGVAMTTTQSKMEMKEEKKQDKK